MTIYQVSYGSAAGPATVHTPQELDAVLDALQPHADGLLHNVSIVIPSDALMPTMLEIGIGHPERSYAYHVADEDDSAWGFEPGLDPVTDLVIDYGGTPTDVWPERSRVGVATARKAAREFVTLHGRRPSCLSWDVED